MEMIIFLLLLTPLNIATIIEAARHVPEIDSSQKTNHLSQVKLVQFPDSHFIIIGTRSPPITTGFATGITELTYTRLGEYLREIRISNCGY